MLVPHSKYITSPLRAQHMNAIYSSVTMVYYYNYTILDIFHRSVFYLKHIMDSVITSHSGSAALTTRHPSVHKSWH
jgi:hypothetical protein